MNAHGTETSFQTEVAAAQTTAKTTVVEPRKEPTFKLRSGIQAGSSRGKVVNG